MMILENKGIKIDPYYIPPFEVRDGELVVIYLYGGSHYYDLKINLVNIFTGKTKNENINIFRSLTFVDHFKEPIYRRVFYPVTVGEYLYKNANFKSNFATKIYEIEWISKKTKVNSLPGNPRKLLYLYSTLSKTSNIIFDLEGQDPLGAKETFQVVKDSIKKGGSAILFDWTEELKNVCSKFITIDLQKI